MASTYSSGKFRNDFAPAKFEGNKEDDLAITSSQAVNAAKQDLTNITSAICNELDLVANACSKLNKHKKSGTVMQRQTANASKHVKNVKTEFKNSVTALNTALDNQIMTSYMDYISKDKKSAASEAASATVENMKAV